MSAIPCLNSSGTPESSDSTTNLSTRARSSDGSALICSMISSALTFLIFHKTAGHGSCNPRHRKLNKESFNYSGREVRRIVTLTFRKEPRLPHFVGVPDCNGDGKGFPMKFGETPPACTETTGNHGRGVFQEGAQQDRRGSEHPLAIKKRRAGLGKGLENLCGTNSVRLVVGGQSNGKSQTENQKPHESQIMLVGSDGVDAVVS